MVPVSYRALAADPVDDATKARTIAYWVTTGLVVFCMTGGIFELLGLETTNEGIMRLGYPSYIIPALGLGKVLAILAILCLARRHEPPRAAKEATLARVEELEARG